MTKTVYGSIGAILVLSVTLWFWLAPPRHRAPDFNHDQQRESDIPAHFIDTTEANPASVYCVEEAGGTVQIITTETGEIGICHLTDGRWCDEWELYIHQICTLPDNVSEAELYTKG